MHMTTCVYSTLYIRHALYSYIMSVVLMATWCTTKCAARVYYDAARRMRRTKKRRRRLRTLFSNIYYVMSIYIHSRHRWARRCSWAQCDFIFKIIMFFRVWISGNHIFYKPCNNPLFSPSTRNVLDSMTIIRIKLSNYRYLKNKCYPY